MITPGFDRRWRVHAPGAVIPERRNGLDRRALNMPKPAMCGVIRPGFADVALRRVRRQYSDARLN